MDYSNAVGAEPLLWLAKNPKTDRGTILLIYWYILLIIGRVRDVSDNELVDWQKKWKKPMKLIEKNYPAGYYKSSKIAYDPKNENGINWTEKFSDSDIPKELFEAVNGKKIEKLVSYDGIPEEVIDLIPGNAFKEEKSIPRSARSIKEFGETEYWLYGPDSPSYKNSYVQAKLVTPSKYFSKKDGTDGFTYGEGEDAVTIRSSAQPEPYGCKLKLVYEVNPKHPRYDNYIESNGFKLYSKRLIDFMKEFGVDFEYFPVKIVDRDGKELLDYDYYIFHPFKKFVDALDNSKTDWSGDHQKKHNGIYLDLGKLKDRPPIFLLAGMYKSFMRNDLKEAIRKRGITGFSFLHPARYKGTIMPYDD